MLLPDYTTPEKSIYFIGAKILESLRKIETSRIDILVLYDFYIRNTTIAISFKFFLLGLDWLFLLGMIKHDKGDIIKCF
jgi:hypothetical protein